jgi:thymidylate synthase
MIVSSLLHLGARLLGWNSQESAHTMGSEHIYLKGADVTKAAEGLRMRIRYATTDIVSLFCNLNRSEKGICQGQ